MTKYYQCDAKFTDNVLAVGQTSCGKTPFAQNLVKNKIFGKLKSVNWILKILLNKSREEQIKKCFEEIAIEYHYPKDLNDFNLLINISKKILAMAIAMTVTKTIILFLVKKKNLISLLSRTTSQFLQISNFSSFLTVYRKFGYSCLYIFHILYLNKSMWQMVICQTKIFNIFPSAIQQGSI